MFVIFYIDFKWMFYKCTNNILPMIIFVYAFFIGYLFKDACHAFQTIRSNTKKAGHKSRPFEWPTIKPRKVCFTHCKLWEINYLYAISHVKFVYHCIILCVVFVVSFLLLCFFISYFHCHHLLVHCRSTYPGQHIERVTVCSSSAFYGAPGWLTRPS